MPFNRIEQYLGNLRGDGNTIPDKPLNRIEKYLAIMCGEDYEIPKPLNRIEQYLADIAENGGGGGGGETVIVPEQTVTTVDQGGMIGGIIANISADINVGDRAVVAFDGVEYEVVADDFNGNVLLGEVEDNLPVFTTYPFAIIVDNGFLVTETAGTYTVKVTKQGGASATIIEKNITANGDYDASSDSADGYNPVHVSVPNSYSAGDEGKVVSSGALVSQTAATYTANSVYDTTLIDEVTVNVSGGGSNPFTLLYETEVEVNTTSTSATEVETVNYSLPTLGTNDVIIAIIYDKVGPRNNYFYYTQARALDYGTLQNAVVSISNGGVKITSLAGYGVYWSAIGQTTGTISARYSSSYKTIDSTYVAKIYKLDVSALM